MANIPDQPGADSASADQMKCGLCGKTGKLTRTPCCGNWICDDADKYVPFSYARNSCFRNHTHHTICGGHHFAGHHGRWQDCAACREAGPLELYVVHATNDYNFEKLPNPPPYEPTHCATCGVIIRLAADSYAMHGKKFLCAACSPLGQCSFPAGAGKVRPESVIPPNVVKMTGQRDGYPAATIAYYGPDNTLATKVVASIVRSPKAEPDPLHRWISHAGDIRKDRVIAAEVEAFLKQHGVKQRIVTERIIGCPHEEGKDYPIGSVCPLCPFWADRDRFTHELLSETEGSDEFQSRAEPFRAPPRTGRNDPCPCGSGKKFKKCCGK